MIELDYAFLANFAVVQAGTLTAVNASFTRLLVPQMPTTWSLAVAGRIRAPQDTGTIPMAIRVISPESRYSLTFGLDLAGDPGATPYQGKLGYLFGLNVNVPLIGEGLYEVFVDIQGVEARRLAFDAVLAPGALVDSQ